MTYCQAIQILDNYFMISNYMLTCCYNVYPGYVKHIKSDLGSRDYCNTTQGSKNSANDAEDLAKRLFILVFKKELELKTSSVCCTKVHSIKIISWEYNVCLTIIITSCLAYCRICCLDIQFSQRSNIK